LNFPKIGAASIADLPLHTTRMSFGVIRLTFCNSQVSYDEREAAIGAVARELTGFIWAISHTLEDT